MNELSNQPSAQTERNFIIFWIGQIFSILGSWVVNFTVNWWVVSTFQDATKISIYSALTYLPFVITVPFAGVWVDRWNKKKTILIFDTIIALSTLTYLIAFQANFTQIWFFILIGAINTSCSAFHESAVAAMVPLMVRRENLSRINGLRTFSGSGIRIIGPIITGILLRFMPLEKSLWIDFITFGIAVCALFSMKLPEPPKNQEKSEINSDHPVQAYFTEFKEGFNAIKNTPVVKYLVILTLIANFLHTPYNTLYTFFIQTTHDGTTIDYSYLVMFSQIGILVGSFLMTLKIKWKDFTQLVILGNIGLGIFSIISAITPYRVFWIMYICNAGSGIMLGIILASYYSVLQTNVAPELQGRIYAFDAFLSVSIMPIAMSLSGLMAEAMGVQFLFVICDGISIVFSCLMFPVYLRIKKETNRNLDGLGDKKLHNYMPKVQD
ncbi:Enterobactin exporter EntS [Candidatus Lokiarchaeum ossiferum]|uniref:Enterobactin exporter EntS n=1 Tax=Candidatus Lokiarchaeum ossiferum TaxID=2951803 RepID=A0ABY6HQP5_9ARCH|nr:Enterobactin exporter EntS [Candidatus Lokiarchaeum sp. B-35]